MSAKSKKKKKESIPLAGVTNKSTEENKTGAWRTFRPRITDRCTGCGACIMYCPEDCIMLIERNGKSNFKNIAKINYEYCKGCLICVNQCPVKAIEKENEK